MDDRKREDGEEKERRRPPGEGKERGADDLFDDSPEAKALAEVVGRQDVVEEEGVKRDGGRGRVEGDST